jgi:phosphomannomutase
MPLLRSPGFVAVDTEAVEDLQVLAAQVTEHRADALISTDGDGDRPLLLDEQGRQVRGDNLGILAASYLGAESAVVPVSSTTAVERSGWFRHVTRTRIGSPWVIEGMQRELESGRRKVVGWEANGGFLTASPITVPGSARSLTPLPTRDALLPILAVLAMARHAGRSVSGLVDGLPPVFTAGGIIRRFPQEQGRQIVDRFRNGGLGQVRSLLGDEFGEPEDLDLTDGARITFADGSVVHLRPSGNAPEFRCYTEAASAQAAEAANRAALDRIRAIADEPEH